MFTVCTIQDDVRVEPKNLNKPPLEAVTEVIEERFLDKVIADVGLVITIYDVHSVEGEQEHEKGPLLGNQLS